MSAAAAAAPMNGGHYPWTWNMKTGHNGENRYAYACMHINTVLNSYSKYGGTRTQWNTLHGPSFPWKNLERSQVILLQPNFAKSCSRTLKSTFQTNFNKLVQFQLRNNVVFSLNAYICGSLCRASSYDLV